MPYDLRSARRTVLVTIAQIHSNFRQAPYTRHTIWHPYCFIILVMRNSHNLDKTTIRLTGADRKILERLTELTGLKQSQLIRASLRVLLRNVERPVEK